MQVSRSLEKLIAFELSGMCRLDTTGPISYDIIRHIININNIHFFEMKILGKILIHKKVNNSDIDKQEI